MRILFITPYVPSRIRVRPFHFIKELAERHDVYVVALGEADKLGSEGVEEIMSSARDFRVVPHSKLRGYAQSLAALPTPMPMCAAFSRSPAMNKAVAEVLSGTKIDLIHIEHLRAAHFAPEGGRGSRRALNLPRDAAREDPRHPGMPPVVFDSVDCLTGLFSQMARNRRNPVARMVMAEEAWKLRRYEPKTLRRFDRVVITSESEREALISLDSSLAVDVVPNGVDIDYFAPIVSASAASRSEARGRRVVFSGKMSYHPNKEAALWFAEKVFPMLKRKWDDAEYVVVGSNPPAEIMKLSEVSGITVTGYVPDIRPSLASAAVAVAPMQVAVGIQNKVLEAMAMGLPVVTSRASARPFGPDCAGVIVADSPEEVAAEVSKLIENPAMAQELGRAGRETAVREFSWKASVEWLESVYSEVVRWVPGFGNPV